MPSYKKKSIFKYEMLMCFLFMMSLTSAQDFVPELPDYMKTSTTTTTTEVPVTTQASMTNTTTPETTSAPTNTDAPTTTPAITTTTTAKPSTTPAMTTTPITPTAPTRATRRPTTTSIPTIHQTPSYDATTYPWPPKRQPSRPDYWNRDCYYKQQRGTAQLKWNCGELQWVFSVDCFHCCYYDFTSFAGCYKVHNQFCAHYLD